MAGKRRAAGPAGNKALNKRPTGKKPAGKTPPKSGRARLKTAAKWTGIVGLVLTVLGVTTFVILYRAIDIPDPNDDFETETTFVYYEDGKSELGRFAVQDRTKLEFEKMPENIKDAVIAAEDRSFWTNPGIDLKGIVRAAFSNARGNATQGASTITQQYVKILYLTQERSYERKIKEAIVSLKIKNQLSKEDILEGYLNTIYFGRGAYGIEAASHAFFGKTAADLDLREAAALAAILNNPTGYDPANGRDNRELLLGRYQYVLDGMAELESITAEEAERASRRLPKFPRIEGEEAYGGQRGHMLDLVKDQLLKLDFTEDQINGGGLRVYTTLSRKSMHAAAAGVREVMPDGVKGLHSAVASVEPGTGALRGFYAGQNYLGSQINWAISGGQPGSTFKPFALAAGIDAGFSLKDTFQGTAPLVLPDGTEIGNVVDAAPTNQAGTISLLTATEKSVNTAYVDLTLSIPDGPEKVIEMANALGIPKDDGTRNMNRLDHSEGLNPDATVALGSASISPINMANAYATIANGGERADVYVIEKVEDRNGEVLYRHRVRTKPVLDEDIAADVSYALQRVVETPGATGNAAQALGRPAAGKTGTATAGDDEHVSSSWFVGYTPQMATAVMNVRGSGTETLEGFVDPYYGGTYPAQTWVSVMRRILEGEPVLDFPPPANVDGEAPDEGHEPITRAPKPTQTTEAPTETETTEAPTTSAPPTTDAPTTEPTQPQCDKLPLPPSCETETPTTSGGTTEEPTQGGGGGGGGGGDGPSNPRTVYYREEYVRP